LVWPPFRHPASRKASPQLMRNIDRLPDLSTKALTLLQSRLLPR
jgi:hypothetical protein